MVYQDDEGWMPVAHVSPTTTTYTITGLKTYTYYEFRVKAKNDIGFSAPSSENYGYITPELRKPIYN